MRLKIVLLPRKLISRPMPYWDIGSVIANIRNECGKIELIDLETENYYTKKHDFYLKRYSAVDIFRKESLCFIRSIIKDIGSIKFDIFHFYIDWWNETLPLAIVVAHQIKKLNKKAKILLTGPYLNSYGKEILDKFKFIDYIAVSEIEPSFKKLLKSSSPASEIPNIIYFDKKKGKIIETKRQITNINSLLFPKFDLYFNQKHPRPKILPFRLSRGCKYRCFFCACLSSEQLRYYRDIDVVVSCLRKYKKIYNVKNFYFEDDALNFSNDYLETFLDKLIKARLNIKWSAYFIAKNLSFAVIKKIWKAGCAHIRWGIESAHPSISREIAKNISISEAEKILSCASKSGISNQISAIVGFPYEKKDSIEMMKGFINKNKEFLSVVNVYPFKPRVNTFVHDYPGRYGIKILEDKTVFKEDTVPFDETKGLKWGKKRIAQQLFKRDIDRFVKEKELLDIDPKEYFKQTV